MSDDELRAIAPDKTFDGGDLDCGSGLVLLIRNAMAEVPPGGVLELTSREPSVRADLPPWCDMVGHELLGELDGDGCARYFIRRGAGAAAQKEAEELQSDLDRARAYEWRVRARCTGHLESTSYCRNFKLQVGQPASFEESDAHPSAVETLLSALAGDLATGFKVACSQAGLEVDDVELIVKGTLDNILVHLGLEEDGDPGLAAVDVKCFATTFDDADQVRALWERTLTRSPIAATLRKACELKTRINIM